MLNCKSPARTIHTLSALAEWFSLTPCFSWVLLGGGGPNRFNGFLRADETVETVAASCTSPHTQLKQGVNERASARRCNGWEVSRLGILAAAALTVLICIQQVFSAATNLFPVADTSLLEPYPTNNLGGATVLLAGTGENLKRHRALLMFDIAGQLPAHAIIKSAGLVLELAWIPANGYEASGMGLHRVLQPWGEGNKLSPTNCSSCQGQGAPASTNEATWQDRLALTTNAWSAPGAAATNDYVAAASASQVIYQFNDSPYGFGSAQMAADVQLWLDNPGTNFGWMLVSQAEEIKFTARRFYSRENVNFPPYLAIEYLIAPRIEGAQKVGDHFSLSFAALPGQSYVVEVRDGFATGAWQTLANIGSVADNTRVIVVDTAAAAQRYYRIRSY